VRVVVRVSRVMWTHEFHELLVSLIMTDSSTFFFWVLFFL
jgi:hypothetical protein